MGVNPVSILASLPFFLTYFSEMPEDFLVFFFALVPVEGNHPFRIFLSRTFTFCRPFRFPLFLYERLRGDSVLTLFRPRVEEASSCMVEPFNRVPCPLGHLDTPV